MKNTPFYTRVGLLCLFLGLVIAFSSCNSSSRKVNHSILPAHNLVEDAKGFELYPSNEGYSILHIINPFEENDTLKYILLPKQVKTPKQFEHLSRISVPVKNIAALSSTHIGMLAALNSSKTISGVSNLNYVGNSTVQERAQEGNVLEIGQNGQLNYENILQSHTEVILSIGMQASNYQEHPALKPMQVSVIPVAEWQETTALGRAEWIKLIGTLVGKEKEAITYYTYLKREWERYTALVSHDSTPNPKIIVGAPFKDVWHIPAGNSFKAHLYQAAKGDYLWADSKGEGSLPLSLETVYPKALQANIWLDAGFVHSIEELTLKDERFKNFPVIKTGEVYAPIKQIAPNGVNLFWENSVTTPHLLLADYIRIFHPGILENDSMVFYQKLPLTSYSN
ncbi:ABC transporter substrate-binding protein [Algivirga pacifica]|uniref:ABC transporter substrate-binding protein n=1 Tax=Algivirga pacifica TaxID=1162670 RepID=A0ABP9D3K9_9BACT